MVQYYSETGMSKRARRMNEEIERSKCIEVNYLYPLYNPALRDMRTLPSGELDTKTIAISLGDSRQKYQQDLLIMECIRLNLTEEEAHEVIKERFLNDKYSITFHEPEKVRKDYRAWCEKFGLQPDDAFLQATESKPSDGPGPA